MSRASSPLPPRPHRRVSFLPPGVAAWALPCLLAAAGAAAAQTESPPTDAPAALRTLDAVSVQALRPSLYALPDVNVGALGAKDPKQLPLSVESYGAALIQAQDARTLMDVLKNDPSVQDTAVGGAMDNIGIRGFPVDWTNTMRRDGMPVAPYYDLPMENIERVDVLKGPSGFLYGMNSPGGSVNYVTKRPTQDRFATLDARLGSHDGAYAALDAGGPFGETAGYRVNLAGERVGDFHHAGDLRRGMLGAAFDIALSPDVLLRLDLDYQLKKQAAQPVVGPQPDGSLPPMFDPRTLLGQPWLQYRTSTYNLGSRLDWRIDARWSLTVQAAKSRNGRDAAFPDIYAVAANGDILSGDLYFSPGQRFDVLSGNAFLTGHFRTGALAHQLVAGVSMRDYRSHEGGFGVADVTVGNLFDPRYSPPLAIAAPPKNVTRNRQPSVFFSDLIDVGAHWSAMLGLRHVRYSSDTDPAVGASTHYRSSAQMPSAGLVYKPRAGLSTYVSYAEGVEQGGVAPYNARNAGEYLAPIKSKQYEAGIKADPTDSLALNAALFRIEKTLQYVDAANLYVQGGKQRHTGVEFSANGRLTGQLALIAGLAWLDTEQLGTGDAATEGKRAANVPRVQSNLFLDYRVAALPGLSANLGGYYVGRRPLDARNSVELPGYVRVDAGLAYQARVAAHPAVWRLSVQNLTDRRYWAAANYGAVWPGMSRSVALSLQIDL